MTTQTRTNYFALSLLSASALLLCGVTSPTKSAWANPPTGNPCPGEAQIANPGHPGDILYLWEEGKPHAPPSFGFSEYDKPTDREGQWGAFTSAWDGHQVYDPDTVTPILNVLQLPRFPGANSGSLRSCGKPMLNCPEAAVTGSNVIDVTRPFKIPAEGGGSLWEMNAWIHGGGCMAVTLRTNQRLIRVATFQMRWRGSNAPFIFAGYHNFVVGFNSYSGDYQSENYDNRYSFRVFNFNPGEVPLEFHGWGRNTDDAGSGLAVSGSWTQPGGDLSHAITLVDSLEHNPNKDKSDKGKR
jgi:hypothetical protein